MNSSNRDIVSEKDTVPKTPQLKIISPPLYWSGGRRLRYVKTSGKNMYTPLGLSGEMFGFKVLSETNILGLIFFCF